MRHRASQSLTKRKESASKLKQNSKNLITKSYWNDKLIQPTKTAAHHVWFNIFHLDRNNMKLGLFYVWSEIKRNNFSFCIGLFTVFISCFVGAFLPAINDKSSVVFVKLAENSVGENDMLLTAAFSGGSLSSTGGNNSTHNETLTYIYDNDWIYDLNVDNISNILAANNITEQQVQNFIQDVNTSQLTNTSNLTIAIMNATGISWKQLNQIIDFWDQNIDNIDNTTSFIDDLLNYQENVDKNLAELNLTEGKEIDWTVQVRNQLLGSNPMLNYTFIEEMLYEVPEVSGSAPRWWLLANVTAGKSKYAASTIVMAIDSALELEAGIGRAWKNVPPLEDNQAYLMNSITRAMNLTGGSDNYGDAVGQDFTMFANLGGFQDSFDMDFPAMFLDTNASVEMEKNLIAQGIAHSCIQVYIKPNSRPKDFSWAILDTRVKDLNKSVLIKGDVYKNTNTCINATTTNYTFVIYDAFGDGLEDYNADDDGYYVVTWDNETALSVKGKFGYGSYDQQILERPSSAYGKSRIVLNSTQQDDLESFLNLVLNPRTQRQIFTSMIQGDDNQINQEVIDEILPDYNASDMVKELQNSSYNDSIELIGGWVLYYVGIGAELTVARSVESGAGKWSALLGSVTVIDAQELSDILFNTSIEFGLAMNDLINAAVGFGYIDSLSTIKNLELLEYYIEEIGASDLYNYAIQTIIMYTDRLDAYMGTLLNLDEHMVAFSNAVFDNLGYQFEATISLPIYSQMQFLTFFKLFLNEMLFLCIVLMTTLVLIVIYSLLLNDVEERTYTYGMLRALGMKRVTLIQIMLLKAITFSIPATFVALILVQLLNIPLIKLIENFAYISLSVKLPSICFINGVLIGFIVPLIAIYVPTSRALSKTLRDSLDVYHHVASDIKVTIIRLEKLGFSVPIMGVAIILVCYGVICSILVPISIYYQSKNVCFDIFDFFELCFGSGYDLFFGIFGSILLSMIYGMCIIAALVSMPLAKSLVHLALGLKSCRHHKLKSVVLKNLNSHSGRNVKTSIMFITTLSFCIFAGVSNSFLTNSAVDFFAWLTGSDFEVYAFWQRDALPIDELSVWLNKQKDLGKIDDFTSITFPISWYANEDLIVDEITVSSLAGTPVLSQWIVGVEENYLNVMFDKFLDIKEIGDYHNGSIPRLKNDNDYDVIKILYSDAGHATLDFEENGIEVPPPILSGRYWTYEQQTADQWTYYQQKNEDIDQVINELNSSYYEYVDIVVSTSLVSALGIDINDPLILTIGVYDNNYRYHSFRVMMKIRAILNKIPGLVMLPYDLQYASFLAEFQNAVISMPAYNKIFKDIADYLEVDVPTNIWQKVAIKMPSDATDNDYDDINEGIRNFVPNQEVEVDDMHEVDRDVRGNISLVNDFFLILGLIGLILSFFILWLSFLANIRNSSWELGVLRSIGINNFQVTMIYIYEALAIIIACIILGTAIGTLTSLILCSQSNLFMMMPLYLDFPWPMYLSICSVALTVAIIGSYLPMRRYIYNNVAAVLRGK